MHVHEPGIAVLMSETSCLLFMGQPNDVRNPSHAPPSLGTRIPISRLLVIGDVLVVVGTSLMT